MSPVNNPTYKRWEEAFPATFPSIKVTFQGLLAFSFDSDKQCEVGIHNQLNCQPPHAQHNLKINVWESSSEVALENFDKGNLLCQFDIGDPKKLKGEDIKLQVMEPAILDGVQVFAPGEFNRLPENHAKDYRWLLDFEGDEFYNLKLKKLPQTLRPSLSLNNGLFYTLYRTNSSFKKEVEDNDAPTDDNAEKLKLGKIAEVMGANIYLKPGGCVSLEVPGNKPINLRQGKQYQIDIINLCEGDDDMAETEESTDFTLYFDAFKLPAKEPIYKLIRSVEIGEVRPSICLEDTNKLTRIVLQPDESGALVGMSSKFAPCTNAGFGLSTNMEDNP